MINGLADQYPEVRQAAAYGVGLMAMKGGAAYAPACTQALQPLAAMIARTDARATEEDTAATENAISAVSKILKYNASTIDVNAVREESYVGDARNFEGSSSCLGSLWHQILESFLKASVT